MMQPLEKQNIWAIGDVQGCYESLMALLAKINFSPKIDGLWLVGDLVNRGPKSSEVLSFCQEQEASVDVVLGNHDLHLLGCWNNVRTPKDTDSMNDLLDERQQNRFEPWLRRQPFYRSYEKHLLIHAGLTPEISLTRTQTLLDEASRHLAEGELSVVLHEFFEGESEVAKAVAGATRIRTVTAQGALNHSYKGSPQDAPEGLRPGFTHPGVDWPVGKRVLFGHWAALGLYQDERVVGLDSGCVWRRALSAFNIKTGQMVQVNRVSA